MTDRIPLYVEISLPRLDLVLFPAHREVILGKNSKPKATGRTVAPGVRISTFPAPVFTSSPDRLRALARQLTAAAAVLERALDGQEPLGL